MIAARGAPLGGHLSHVIVLAAWLAVIIAVLLIDHIREHRRSSAEVAPTTTTTAPAPISMATWPPRRPRRPAAPAPRVATVERSRWIWLAVAGSLIAAAVHLVVIPEHFEESYWYGGFFVVTATAQVGYAALLAVRPRRVLLQMGVAGSGAVILLWMYTRMIAVPLGPGRGETESVGGLDVLASSAELLVVVGCLIVLLRVRPSQPESTGSQPRQVGAAVAP